MLLPLAGLFSGGFFRDGKKKTAACLVNRQRKQEAAKSLPDDMVALKRQVKILMDLTGAVDEEADMGEDTDMEGQPLIVKDDSTNGDDYSIENEIQT